MKKTISLLLSIILTCGIFYGCINKDNNANSQDQTVKSQEVTPFVKFNAKTIAGEEISDKIFNDYDLTMVNVWATWCGPCVGEMGELEKLYKSLDDNVNLITICSDSDSNIGLVNNILKSKGATFKTIAINEQLENDLMSTIQAFPTSFFVDRDGNIVDQIMGVPRGDVVEEYTKIIKERLGESE